MTYRFKARVAPSNRNSDYGYDVTVLADTASEAMRKATALASYSDGRANVWIRGADEIEPQPQPAVQDHTDGGS
ncbi:MULTISPECIES: hypothetical protein [Microbacterium]|uniref:Uncharacterized protein n=1 Tax=Microbacterium hominis TaxID=162426 RepID=A0A2K9DSG5_9MICO|nr:MULTISPECIES: hypothetical protein [Microbacterium]AUG28764.1 hypothetical protein CXR34_04275 [Microbacterium hominis]